jgi:hypothetical protein
LKPFTDKGFRITCIKERVLSKPENGKDFIKTGDGMVKYSTWLTKKRPHFSGPGRINRKVFYFFICDRK